MTPDEQAPYAAALSDLPGMGPATLVGVLSRWSPAEAWSRIVDGSLVRPDRASISLDRDRLPLHGSSAGPEATGAVPVADPPRAGLLAGKRAPAPAHGRSWAAVARRLDPPAWWSGASAKGIQVTWWGHDSYPAALRQDHQPPAVLFWVGSIDALRRPCVAIVGTRQASPDGRAIAFELGRDLAGAGVCVVSGLALGIDGAAHVGALDGWANGGPIDPAATASDAHGGDGPAAPVGVAASGVDVPYPRRHARLWARVAEAGAVLSETLPGRPAEAWRFPTRNRIIAGLVRMVVVVESHLQGGSLITAEAATARGIDVRVVPGPVHSPACAGSNQLLYDGPGPVRDAWDVLDGLGIFVPDGGRPRAGRRPPPPSGGRPPRPGGSLASGWPSAAPGGAGAAPPTPPAHEVARAAGPAPATPTSHGVTRADTRWPEGAGRVLEATGWRPASLGQIVRRSNLPVPTTMALLDHLEAAGAVSRKGDWWVRTR